jgi:Nodulation protein Z (NodZ)
MTGLPASMDRLLRSVGRRSRLAADRWERRLRHGLAAAGIPVRRPRLILRCNRGAEGAGLFSEVRVVLGALAHYEQWQLAYAGLQVDYAALGLYHDPDHGPNWWQYFFESIDLGRSEGAATVEVSPLTYQVFAEAGERLSRERGAELIARYVHPKPMIRDAVDAYVARNFRNAHVVGIHYRGTNKHEEAPRVPYERVRAAAADILRRAGAARSRLFVATDEQAFLDYMRSQFPRDLLYREMFRSADGRPIDEVNEDGGYRKGEDAVIDCLLLSRCHTLIRTESNLSVCATLFNPALPQLALNGSHP